MKLSCSQMEILMSFYLEDELSPCLKQQVEAHMNSCDVCAEKFKIVSALFGDIKSECNSVFSDSTLANYNSEHELKQFKTNLSAYIDNELSNEESLKMKKVTITNKQARKALEDSYNIRRLMSDSYKKSKSDAKKDYSRSIIKQLEIDSDIQRGFYPAINLLIIFTVTVLVITTVVLLALSP